MLPGLLAFLTGCPETSQNSPDAKPISAPEDLNKPGWYCRSLARHLGNDGVGTFF